MRSARRVATLIVTVCTTAVLVALAPAAYAAPQEEGKHCILYNGQVVYCVVIP